MGIGASHFHSSNDVNESRQRKIHLQADFIYPKFYIKNAIIETFDRDNVRDSWNHVSSNTSPEFSKKRENDPNFLHSTCMVWFFHVFYDRLFDVHPEVKHLFQGNILKQGHKLVDMITLIIDLLEKSDSILKQTLTKLVKVHHGLGVLPSQYNFVVETLLYSLEMVVGRNIMDGNVRLSWLKCLSRMLSIMVPAAVEESMSDMEKNRTMCDLERSDTQSSKSNGSKSITTTTGRKISSSGTLTLNGSRSTGNLLLQSEKSMDESEADYKDHEMNNRRTVSISCPVGGGLQQGMILWERNNLGDEGEVEDEEEQTNVQELESMTRVVSVHVDLGDAQMNI